LFSNLLYPIAGVVADRLAYFASLGYCLFIGFILSFAFKTDNKEIKISFLKFSILLIFFSTNIAYSISRNKDWYNHLTLMRNDISYLNKSAQAHNLLANQLMSYSFKEEHKNESNEMRQEAIQHFKKALEIYPNFFNATYDLGRCYMIMNQSDSALILFEKTYQLDSTFSDALYNIAIIYDQKNDLELAKNYYKKTIKINKSNLDAYLGLSYAYYRMNSIDSAIITNMEALKVNPNWKEPKNNLLYLNSL
jgi:tetratricopeptide (TPR) repeat protein